MRSAGILYLIIFQLNTVAFGQQVIQVYADEVLTDSVMVRDSLDKEILVREYLSDRWSEGYFFSGLDSVINDQYFFHLGHRFDHGVSELFLRKGTYNTYYPIRIRNHLKSALKDELKEYVNQGFPFAQVRWDSLQTKNGFYQGYLTLDPGPEILCDSIVLLSPIGINKKYLSKAIGMENEAPFSEYNFDQIPVRLQRLPFLRLNQPPDVAFENGKSYLFLDLEKQNVNTFEGVIGFLPGQSATQSLVVTGYLDLQLYNLFQSGKQFGFTWNRFANQSQALDLSYKHPYLLSSRLFLNTDFHLFKQDTTFLNQSWNLLLGTYVGKKSELYFGYEAMLGSLINPLAEDIQNGLSDYKTRTYSVGIRDASYQMDFKLKSGFRYYAKALIGDKAISKNPALPDSTYGTVNLKTTMFKWNGGFKYQFRLGKYSAIYQQVESQLYYNNQILTNELMRIGGLRTIRGFNEKFFYAQHYAFSRLEYRRYFEERSYFMVFYDQAFLKDQFGDYLSPRGFGGGLSLNTSNGLFTFALALGSTKNIPLDPANIKVHIGYTSTF